MLPWSLREAERPRRVPMAGCQHAPLRPLTTTERTELEQRARATAARADRVARAKVLLAVADGAPFTVAARAAGRRSGVAVAHLVARFNTEGLAALASRHGGGPPVQYGTAEQARILREFRRSPTGSRTGPRPGRSRPCSGLCTGHPTGSPR